MSDIAKLLLDWRKAKRLTQPAAAEWLSRALSAPVPLSTLRKWEQRASEPHGIARASIENAIRLHLKEIE